ncbi:MAG: hypothetical protein HWD61_15160 [Parachlamydiaceae bacterium]|nr:MAG: hypothetical protein HWD61_15160 [Parachlamydiaceae bacterium]
MKSTSQSIQGISEAILKNSETSVKESPVSPLPIPAKSEFDKIEDNSHFFQKMF